MHLKVPYASQCALESYFLLDWVLSKGDHLHSLFPSPFIYISLPPTKVQVSLVVSACNVYYVLLLP